MSKNLFVNYYDNNQNIDDASMNPTNYGILESKVKKKTIMYNETGFFKNQKVSTSWKLLFSDSEDPDSDTSIEDELSITSNEKLSTTNNFRHSTPKNFQNDYRSTIGSPKNLLKKHFNKSKLKKTFKNESVRNIVFNKRNTDTLTKVDKLQMLKNRGNLKWSKKKNIFVSKADLIFKYLSPKD